MYNIFILLLYIKLYCAKPKNNEKRNIIFIHLFIIWLKRRQLDSQISFSLLQYVVLVKVFEKNPPSLRYMGLDKGDTWISFFGNCQFSFDTTPEPHKWYVLKTYLQCGI